MEKTIVFPSENLAKNLLIKLNLKITQKKAPDNGGITDYLTNKSYFHGGSQTDQPKTLHPSRVERSTQVFDQIAQATNMKREASTQCPRSDLFLDS